MMVTEVWLGLLALAFCSPTYAQYINADNYGTLHTSNWNTSETGDVYDYVQASFGPNLKTGDFQTKAFVHMVPSSNAGCFTIDIPPLDILPDGVVWVAIIERSRKGSPPMPECDFITKVLNAQNAGFGAVIIYDYGLGALLTMNSNNVTLSKMVKIPSAFILNGDGLELSEKSFPDLSPYITEVAFIPTRDEIDPYQILIPMAFTFVGILLISCIVMIVRWCQMARRKRRSRISRTQLKKIPLQKYKKGDQYDCCAICLDDYSEGEKLRLLPCEHTYHQKCIDPWLLKNKKTCPVCKRRVVPRSTRRNSETDSDSDGEDNPTQSENSPLLPPQTLEERGAAGGRNFYGSGLPNSMRDQIQYDSSSDDDDNLQRRQFRAAHDTSSSEEDDDPRGLLIQVCVTPDSVRNQATSLTAFTNPIPDVPEECGVIVAGVPDPAVVVGVPDPVPADHLQMEVGSSGEHTQSSDSLDSADRSVIV